MESEDGKSWSLASGVPGAKKKRWKVGCLNKMIAREMEAAIKTRLLLGHEKTEQAKPMLFKDHVVLKHCLTVAIRRGLLQVNPATRVPLPDPQNARDRVLTEEEWSRLYHVAKPHLRPVLLTAYQLGQRLSEIVGITWDRIDLKGGFITLRSQDTKTKKPRQVPMTSDVKATLHRLAKVRSLSTRHVFL